MACDVDKNEYNRSSMMPIIPGDYHGDEQEIEAEQNELRRLKEECAEDFYNNEVNNEQ